jgi:hypothetical protein
MCLYLWLEYHLTEDDKQVLHFDAICVELLLCKIGRWKHMAFEIGKIDLLLEPHQLFEGDSWEKGANLSDYKVTNPLLCTHAHHRLPLYFLI